MEKGESRNNQISRVRVSLPEIDSMSLSMTPPSPGMFSAVVTLR